jgi:endoglucanase
VVISEFGDHNAPGTTDAPFVSRLLPWADQHGASYLGWAWDAWQDKDNVLIKNSAGDPTDGYGVYVKQHLLCVASGKPPCH